MARKRGSRFRRAIDAQEQLEDLEIAQQARRQGKTKKLVDSTGKSRQRFDNSLRRIQRPQNAPEEYEV